MLVLTIDQRSSRRGEDAVPELLGELQRSVAPLRPFQRTAGDEIQAVFDDAGQALDAILAAGVSGRWSVGVGGGEVRLPLPAETRAGAGPAYELAREAVEAAKRTQALVAVRLQGHGTEAERIQAELALLLLTLRRRSEAQRLAVGLREEGRSQKQIAAKLGVSQQAISARLGAALWEECAALGDAVRGALEPFALADGAGGDAPSSSGSVAADRDNERDGRDQGRGSNA